MPATRQLKCHLNHRGFGKGCHRCWQAREALAKVDELSKQLGKLGGPKQKLGPKEKIDKQALLEKISALQAQAEALKAPALPRHQ